MKVLKWLPKSRGIFVTGTDTEVGKTTVSAIIVKQLREEGISVGVMKPVSTGSRKDAAYLKKTAGVEDSLEIINPVFLKKPLAPLAAARIDKKKINLERIWQAYKILKEKYDFLVIEGAGGLLVPVTKKSYIIDIAKRFGLPLVIVSRPGLGTINHTLLTACYARNYGLNVAGFIINYTKPCRKGMAERTNPKLISQLGKIKLLGIVPYIRRLKTKGQNLSRYNLGRPKAI